MFGIARENQEESRNVRKSHMDSLPYFPLRLVDRDALSDPVPSCPSSSGHAPRRERNLQCLRDGEVRTRTPRSAPSGPRREAIVEKVEVLEREEDEEEQLRPRQRRRTSPRHPSTEVVVVSPSPPSTHLDTLEEHLPLEIQEATKSVPTAAEAENPTKNSGPLCLQSGFEIPTKAETLRDLAGEISSWIPPLTSIRLTKRFAASYLGGAILKS